MKAFKVFLAGLCSLLATACSGGSYSISVGQLGSTDNSITGNYKSFSGYYFRQEKFVSQEKMEFQFNVYTKTGSISAQLLDSDGDVISSLTDDDTVIIPKTGTYKIEVQANQHQGDFLLTWHEVAAN